jgi:hypothetical protein
MKGNVFSQGDQQGDKFYIILKGKVQVSIPDMYSKDEQTKEEITNELLNSERNHEGKK